MHRGAWRRCRCALLGILLVAGCAGGHDAGEQSVLTQEQALKLAVELANKECEVRFKAQPFDLASYPIRFQDGYWSWGGLDLAGPHGLSASVSFDARGEDRHVEAYLSTDTLDGRYGPDSTRLRERRP